MPEYTCRWLQLDPLVGARLWWVLREQLGKKVHVASTCTDPNGRFGSPYILTELCYEDDVPFFKAESRKGFFDSDDAWTHQYFIAGNVKEATEDDEGSD